MSSNERAKILILRRCKRDRKRQRVSGGEREFHWVYLINFSRDFGPGNKPGCTEGMGSKMGKSTPKSGPKFFIPRKAG